MGGMDRQASERAPQVVPASVARGSRSAPASAAREPRSTPASAAREPREDAAPTGPGAPALSWDDLRIALAVARCRSLARAAEVLGVDPATVSRRIAALEAALGAILFARSKLGVAPTDAGDAVIARAIEIEHRAMRIEDDIAAVSAVRGAVRIAGGVWTTARIAGVAAPILRASHPGLQLRLISGRAPIDLPGGEAAVSVWFEAPARPGEFSISLGEVPYAVYAAASSAPGDDAAEEDAPSLAHRNEDGPLRAPDRWAQGQKAPGGGGFALTATDSLILREAVAAGMGPALLPMCLGEGDPRLRRVGGRTTPSLVRTLTLHTHPDTVQLARVQAVIECLRNQFDRIFGRGVPTPRLVR